MKRFRKLKIHSKIQARRRNHISVPEIRLEGKWLEELGFNKGEHIQIKQQKDKLTITLCKEKSE